MRFRVFLLCAVIASLCAFGYAVGPVAASPDVLLGPEYPADPGASREVWRRWHEGMLETRRTTRLACHFDETVYNDPATAWSDTSFRQYLLFLPDESFYDRVAGRYRTEEWIARARSLYGRVDSVLLWHSYPQLGFDSRNQFDHYRTLPGGIARLRAQVSDVFHRHGIRVFLDLNPWDEKQVNQDVEMAELVGELDADGVMLDTLDASPTGLKREVAARRGGVAFAPERRPGDEQLSEVRQSWAQWYDLGDSSRAAIYRHKWIAPHHQQYAIRRWDTHRRWDIVFSFFNASGLLIWDNVFGVWNPYSDEDRVLLARTASALRSARQLLTRGEWSPLIPTGVVGLDTNDWHQGESFARLFRNRRDTEVYFDPSQVGAEAPAPEGYEDVFLWPGRDERGRVRVEAGGAQAWLRLPAEQARLAREDFDRETQATQGPRPGYSERTPEPHPLAGPVSNPAVAPSMGSRFVRIPEGLFEQKIEHPRRESGCYTEGATREALWGWFYKDLIRHQRSLVMPAYSLGRTAVTNDEYLAFVRESGYRPRDGERFLAQIPRLKGVWPSRLDPGLGALPVTYVSLEDARAYADYRGERLPTEAQWQWAAESAGTRQLYPWGDARREFPPYLRAADADPELATRQGVLGLSGNAWEWTESEWSDGHNRFAMLRGGTYLPPPPLAETREWVVDRGARPNTFHAKYFLTAPALDRSEAISFRTVRD